MKRFIAGAAFLALFAFPAVSRAQKPENTAIAGNPVIMPAENVKLPLPENSKIYGATVHTSFLLYALVPERLVGWGYPLRDYETGYIDKKYLGLPVLGCWSGGASPDKEALLRARPDIAFSYGSPDQNSFKKMKDYLKELGIPLAAVNIKTLDDYPEAFLALGKIFGVEKRAEAMSKYAEEAITKAAALWKNIPEEKRPSVFMAAGKNGLRTVCGNSGAFEIIYKAGGKNAYECSEKSSEHSGPSLTMEKLAALNPDFIVTENKDFYKNALKDDKWKNLNALKNGRFILMPNEPFRWNMHGLYTALLGIQYFSCSFYPDKCGTDMAEETIKFMKVFFDKDISKKTAENILTPAARQ